MILNIAIDADSLIFKACYRHQIEGGVNIEQAYLEFCFEVGKIRSAVFKIVEYHKGDFVKPLIVLSPKHTFRNDLDPEYKANRPPLSIYGIKQLKIMVMHRLKNWAMVVPNVEADDVVYYYADKHNYMVAAIDKDVIMSCPTSCYNYNYRNWVLPNSKYDIERWWAQQALMGDSADNIKGAPGIGKEKAIAWVNKFVGEPMSWTEFIEMFGDESIAIQTMNLVRMDSLVKRDDKLVFEPWSPWNDSYWDF